MTSPRCADCSSYRKTDRWSVAGYCLLKSGAVLPDRTPDVIGPSAYLRNRHFYFGPIWTCFIPAAVDNFDCSSSCSVSTTATNSPSGEKSTVLHKKQAQKTDGIFHGF